MSIVVPNIAEIEILEYFLNRTLYLKLFANDIIPDEDNTLGSFTEVAGGGYNPIILNGGNWNITPGNPSIGLYNSYIDFLFSGVTNGSGEIFGYYVITSAEVLCWAERFAEEVLPYTPEFGSLIRITPRFQVS